MLGLNTSATVPGQPSHFYVTCLEFLSDQAGRTGLYPVNLVTERVQEERGISA